MPYRSPRSFLAFLILSLSYNTAALVGAASLQSPDDKCNICGCKDCLILEQVGSVEFHDQNDEFRKFPCKQLQNQLDTSFGITQKFCREELYKYTVDICKCHWNTGDPVELNEDREVQELEQTSSSDDDSNAPKNISSDAVVLRNTVAVAVASAVLFVGTL